jgi:NADH-quinone oxidoreductase subunit M
MLSLLIWASFDPPPGFQFVESSEWLGGSIDLPHGRRRHFDAVRHPDDLPDAALHPGQLEFDQEARAEYMIAFLVLETLMIGVFCALDIVLFYVFFEGGLIPMFIIIGVWGGKRRVYAAFKFFLYTLLGSVLMLLAIMAMYWDAGTTDIRDPAGARLPGARCRPGCGWPSSPPSR